MTWTRNKRLKLIQTLNAITPEQLEVIIFTLSPQSGVVPPLSASQGNRVAALLNWADSPGGCGLVEVKQVLDEIINPGLDQIANSSQTVNREQEPEDYFWTRLSDWTFNISNCSRKQWQLKRVIYRDIQTQFQNSSLRFPKTAVLAEKECRNIFPSLNHTLNEDNHLPWDQLAWAGLQESEVISALRDLQHPIRISVHTMMVAAIVTLLSLKYLRGIELEIDWQSGTSPEQINRLANNQKIYHFLFTADAGMNYATNQVLFDYSRLFTCLEETQYVLGKKQTLNEEISLAYITPGTTQQIHYELWSSENRLPKDKIELRGISDTPNVVENISSREVFILTRQKSRRFLREYPLTIIGTEKRGLSFSMYHHNFWINQPLQLQQFIRAFVTEWNFCRTAFLHGKLARFGLKELLRQIWHSDTFLNAYSIASDFELLSIRNL